MHHPAGPNQFVFEDRPAPLPETELRIEGALPDCVRGQLLCNGTGQLRLGGEQLHLPAVVCEVPEINPAFRGSAHRYGYATAQTSGDDSHDAGAYPWFGGVARPVAQAHYAELLGFLSHVSWGAAAP